MESTTENILKISAEEHIVTPEDIRGKSRKAKISSARHLYCYLVYKNTLLTYHSIGKTINRSHSGVMHSVKQVENQMSISKVSFQRINILCELIKPKLKEITPALTVTNSYA